MPAAAALTGNYQRSRAATTCLVCGDDVVLFIFVWQYIISYHNMYFWVLQKKQIKMYYTLFLMLQQEMLFVATIFYPYVALDVF